MVGEQTSNRTKNNMTTNKQLFDKADEMSEALTKLTDGLAKDGVAINGFIDAIRVINEWQTLKFKISMERYYNKISSANKQTSKKISQMIFKP